MNETLEKEGYGLVEFVLTDLWPDIKAWEAIVKRHDHIRFIRESIGATEPKRLARQGRKEYRIFNLCFHHFDDEGARKMLKSAVESADAFVYVFIFDLQIQNSSKDLLPTTFSS